MRTPGGGSFTDQPFGNGGSRDRQRNDRDDEENADPEPEPEPDPQPSPAERFRDELGGDPVDGGSDPPMVDEIQREDPGAPSGGETGPAEPAFGDVTGGGSGPQSPPSQDNNSSSSRPASEPSPSNEFGEEVGGDPAGDSQSSGPLDNLVENTLNPAAEAFDEEVAETAGEAIRSTSPATLVDSQIRGGNPVGRTVENTVRGGVNVLNAPGIAAGAIRAGQRAADDTARVNEQGAEGRQQNRQELVADVTGAAAATGAAIQDDPVGTLSRIGGGIVGGAALGGAASRAARGLRGTPDAPDTPDGTVPSGRSDPGTGGVDSILEDVDVDARRGTSGPSTRSQFEGELSRAVNDVSERVEDSPLGDFVQDTRAQLQQQRPNSRDTASAPDRTRPPDVGGSFEDIRQDSLTQTQDQLRSDATRPDPGTFDNAPQPFRSGGGDTIDPDGGVSLQRGSAIVDDVDAAAGSSSAGGSSVGSGAGLGSLSAQNDPTGIADTGVTAGTALDPEQLLGAGGDSAGADSVSAPNYATGISPEVREQLGGGRLGGGTLPSDVTGTDTTTDTDSATATQTDTDTDVGTGSGTGTSTGGGTETPQTTPITDPTGGTGATTDATTRSAASAASFNDSGDRRPRTPELSELFSGDDGEQRRSSGQDSFTFGFDPEVGIFGEDL